MALMGLMGLTGGEAWAQKRDAMAMPVVEEDSIMKHIIELSAETYEGRLAGTVGYDRAAKYVEQVLRRYGAKVSEQRRTASSTSIFPVPRTNAFSPWAMTSAAPE